MLYPSCLMVRVIDRESAAYPHRWRELRVCLTVVVNQPSTLWQQERQWIDQDEGRQQRNFSQIASNTTKAIHALLGLMCSISVDLPLLSSPTTRIRMLPLDRPIADAIFLNSPIRSDVSPQYLVLVLVWCWRVMYTPMSNEWWCWADVFMLSVCVGGGERYHAIYIIL